MTRYASDTSVSVDRSVAAIRSTVQRYGATAFMQAEDETRAMVGFKMAERIEKAVACG